MLLKCVKNVNKLIFSMGSSKNVHWNREHFYGEMILQDWKMGTLLFVIIELDFYIVCANKCEVPNTCWGRNTFLPLLRYGFSVFKFSSFQGLGLCSWMTNWAKASLLVLVSLGSVGWVTTSAYILALNSS